MSPSPWLDLSHPYYEGMSAIKSFRPFKSQPLFTIAQHGLNVATLDLVTHMGTHVDAPCHFIAGGASIDSYPVSRFAGRGVCLDLPREAEQAIAAADLERASPAVQEGDIVLLRTGWSRHYSKPLPLSPRSVYREGRRRSRDDKYFHGPYLSDDAAQWLVRRKVSIVGIDALTVDLPPPLRREGFRFPVHHALLGAGVLIIENLVGLEQVAGRRIEVAAFPLKVRRGDGAPARVVARVVG